MAVYKIFPTKDATLYSLYPSMNTGLDAILEVSNIQNLELKPDVARYLIEFDTDEIVDTIDALPLGRYLSIIPWSILVHKNFPKLYKGKTKILLYNSSKYHLFKIKL